MHDSEPHKGKDVDGAVRWGRAVAVYGENGRLSLLLRKQVKCARIRN